MELSIIPHVAEHVETSVQSQPGIHVMSMRVLGPDGGSFQVSLYCPTAEGANRIADAIAAAFKDTDARQANHRLILESVGAMVRG